MNRMLRGLTDDFFCEIGYYSVLYGIDMRICVIYDPENGAEVSLGLGYNHFEAGFASAYTFTVTPSIITNGGIMSFGWDSNEYYVFCVPV
jgi:hypothetical protein